MVARIRILGIDPGLAHVGYGIIERRDSGVEHVLHGVVNTPARHPTAQRLLAIYRELSAVIDEHKPDEVAIEELFFGANVKTVISVSQARGVAILATAASEIPLAEYSPLQIKLALVGYGRASKRQVQMMVKALLRLEEVPRPDHAADALAAALCHLHALAPLRALREAARQQASSAGEMSENKILLGQQRSRRRRRR